MTPDVPSPGSMTREWLVARFGSNDSPGWSPVEESIDGEQTFSRTGGPTCLCWGSAGEVVAELGEDRAAVTGYFCAEDSRAKMAEHAEGHDLAIVDGRFLIDGWLAHVIQKGPCVLDLEDPVDRARAETIHEPFERWTIQPNSITRTEKS